MHHDDLKRILGDDRAARVLTRLHARARRENVQLAARLLPHVLRWVRRKPLPWERLGPRISDLSLALDPQSGIFAYLLARAVGARCVVEYGTSVGVSTIYLALAVRANGGGCVIGTEIDPSKAALAAAHVQEAGLEAFVDVREGDAVETLANLEDLDGPVDLLHNDGFPGAMLPVTRLIAARMRSGGVVMAGNAALFPADHAEYVAWMRDPANGFTSARLPTAAGGELSVRG